ncbi:MAG: putative Ig domain-containing protein [Candidatus Methanomethylophilaceae archaeon]
MKTGSVGAILSIICASILVMCAIPIAASAADTTNEYDVDMRVGDSFSYTIETSLESVITVTGSALEANDGFLIFVNSTKILSGTPDTAGSYTVTIAATWTSEDGETTQTATQTINFTISERVALTSAVYAYALAGNAFSYSLTYSGPEGTIVTPDTISRSWLTYDSDTKILSGTPTTDDVGATTAAFTIANASTSDTQTVTVTVQTFASFGVVSANNVVLSVGDELSLTLQSNLSSGVTWTADLSAVSDVSDIAISNGVISGTFTSSAISEGIYKDYQITVTASATINDEIETATQTITIRVYTDIGYLSLPEISNVKILSTDDDKKIILSANVSAALHVTYTWGDGSYTTFEPAIAIGSHIIAHEYSANKIYTVQITAINDVGSSSSFMMYDAGSGIFETTEAPTFLDEHGYFFVVLACIAALMFLAYYVTRNPYIAVASAIFGLLSVLCLVLKVTGLDQIIEYIKSLL